MRPFSSPFSSFNQPGVLNKFFLFFHLFCLKLYFITFLRFKSINNSSFHLFCLKFYAHVCLLFFFFVYLSLFWSIKVFVDFTLKLQKFIASFFYIFALYKKKSVLLTLFMFQTSNNLQSFCYKTFSDIYVLLSNLSNFLSNKYFPASKQQQIKTVKFDASSRLPGIFSYSENVTR